MCSSPVFYMIDVNGPDRIRATDVMTGYHALEADTRIAPTQKMFKAEINGQ